MSSSTACHGAHPGHAARRAGRLAGRVRRRHAGVRAPPEGLASAGPDGLQVGPGGDFSEAILHLYAAFATTYPAGPPPGDEAIDAARGRGAHQRRRPSTAPAYVTPMPGPGPPARSPSPRDPEWDFHEFVSLLGHHPQLLRILGIAVELRGRPPGQPGTVRVHTDYDNGTFRQAVDFVMHTTARLLGTTEPDQAVHRTGRTASSGSPSRVRSYRSSTSARAPTACTTSTSGSPATPGRCRRSGRGRSRSCARTSSAPSRTAPSGSGRSRRTSPQRSAMVSLSSCSPRTWRSATGSTCSSRRARPPCGAACSSGRPTPPATTSRPATGSTGVPEPDEGWTTTTLVTELVETFAEPDPDVKDPFVPLATRRLDDQLYRWDGWSGAVRPPGSAVDGSGRQGSARNRQCPRSATRSSSSATYEVVPGSLAAAALRPPVPDAGPLRRPLGGFPAARRGSPGAGPAAGGDVRPARADRGPARRAPEPTPGTGSR